MIKLLLQLSNPTSCRLGISGESIGCRTSKGKSQIDCRQSLRNPLLYEGMVVAAFEKMGVTHNHALFLSGNHYHPVRSLFGKFYLLIGVREISVNILCLLKITDKLKTLSK